MDLRGPMRTESINGKKYVLVIVDDYTRFGWVRFLRTKDETPQVIEKFIVKTQRALNATVRSRSEQIMERSDKADIGYLLVCTHKQRRTDLHQKNVQDSGNGHVAFDELTEGLISSTSYRPRTSNANDFYLFQWLDDDEVLAHRIPPGVHNYGYCSGCTGTRDDNGSPFHTLSPEGALQLLKPLASSKTSTSHSILMVETLFDHVAVMFWTPDTVLKRLQKTRLVAKGSGQEAGIDFEEIICSSCLFRSDQTPSLLTPADQPEGFCRSELPSHVYRDSRTCSLMGLTSSTCVAKPSELHLTVIKAIFSLPKWNSITWDVMTHGEVLLVQLNFLDIGLLAGHPKSRKVPHSTTEAEIHRPIRMLCSNPLDAI
ncbi:retrovirus-related pol polyprotein from transposon TNT 1-94 [Tanacetum coccineum]